MKFKKSKIHYWDYDTEKTWCGLGLLDNFRWINSTDKKDLVTCRKCLAKKKEEEIRLSLTDTVASIEC